ncbi:hypothetical protein PM082_023974 [Marasmius tenuissimus]|nr:hypothetical protein PM082_023974 [Marasmius tenuissimus]
MLQRLSRYVSIGFLQATLQYEREVFIFLSTWVASRWRYATAARYDGPGRKCRVRWIRGSISHRHFVAGYLRYHPTRYQ